MRRAWTIIFAVALGFAALSGCASDKALEAKVTELQAQITELQATLADVNLRLEEMNSSLFVLREGTRNNREAIKKLEQQLQTPTVYIEQPPEPEMPIDTTPPEQAPGDVAALPLPAGTGQPSSDDRTAFDAAQGQVERQNWGLAVYDMNAFISQHPSSPLVPRARYSLGESYRNLGEYAQAAREYERCLAAGEAAGPFAPRSLYWIVVCYRQLGQAEKADRAQARLLQEYPESPEAKKITLETPR